MSNEKITTKQKKALTAMLGGSNKGQAAAAAGVTARTMSRWMAQPEFTDMLHSEAETAVHAARRRLSLSLDLAIDAIHQTLTEPILDASITQARLRAAQMAIDAGLKLIETSDLMQRLDAIEQRLEAQK